MEYTLARQTIVAGAAAPGTLAYTQALEVPEGEYVTTFRLIGIVQRGTGGHTVTATLEGSNDGANWVTGLASVNIGTALPDTAQYQNATLADLAGAHRLVRLAFTVEQDDAEPFALAATLTTAARRRKRGT